MEIEENIYLDEAVNLKEFLSDKNPKDILAKVPKIRGVPKVILIFFEDSKDS